MICLALFNENQFLFSCWYFDQNISELCFDNAHVKRAKCQQENRNFQHRNAFPIFHPYILYSDVSNQSFILGLWIPNAKSLIFHQLLTQWGFGFDVNMDFLFIQNSRIFQQGTKELLNILKYHVNFYDHYFYSKNSGSNYTQIMFLKRLKVMYFQWAVAL